MGVQRDAVAGDVADTGQGADMEIHEHETVEELRAENARLLDELRRVTDS